MWRMLASTAPLTCCVSFKSMKLWQVLFLSMSWGLFYCTKQTGIKVPGGGRSHSGLWSHHKSGADIKTSVNEREKVESIQGLHNYSQLLHFFVCFFRPIWCGRAPSIHVSLFFFCQPQNKKKLVTKKNTCQPWLSGVLTFVLQWGQGWACWLVMDGDTD